MAAMSRRAHRKTLLLNTQTSPMLAVDIAMLGTREKLGNSILAQCYPHRNRRMVTFVEAKSRGVGERRSSHVEAK